MGYDLVGGDAVLIVLSLSGSVSRVGGQGPWRMRRASANAWVRRVTGLVCEMPMGKGLCHREGARDVR